MTVPEGVTNITAQCNGSVVDFPFTFGAGSSGDLKVVRTDATATTTVETTLTEGVDYTVACTNNDCTGGGTVTTTIAYATGNSITILLDIPVSQDAKFTEGMASLYESFELVVDKVTRLIQQQQEQIGRGVQLPVSSSQTDLQIPDPDALKVLRWNSLADALENVDVSTLSAYSIATFAQSFLENSGTVTEGLALLGLGKYHANPSETDQGAAGSGETLKAFVDSIGSANETIYFRAGTYTLTTSETVPSNITLVLADGAVFVGDGTLTVNGPFEAGIHQVFNWGLGGVVFARGSVTEVYPDWWTQNVTPGTTDMTSAINQALAALPDRGSGMVTFIDLNLISTSIDLTGFSGLTLAGTSASYESEGEGKVSEVITASDITAFTMDYGVVGSHTSGITFTKLKITGYATTGTSSGIYFDTSTFWGVILIDACDIRGFNVGVQSNVAAPLGWLTIQNSNIQNNYWGVYVSVNVLRILNNMIYQNDYDATIDTNILDDSSSGGGIYLITCLSAEVIGNDLEGQNIGVYVVSTCQGVLIKSNYFEANIRACAILRTSYDVDMSNNLYSSTNNDIGVSSCDRVNISDTRCNVYDGQANLDLFTNNEPTRVETMDKTATAYTGRRAYTATSKNVGEYVQPVLVDPVGSVLCTKWGTNDSPTTLVSVTDAAETTVPSPIAKGVRIITQTALNGYAQYAIGSTAAVGDHVTCIALVKGNAIYGEITGGVAVSGTMTINDEWSFVIFEAVATSSTASLLNIYPAYGTSDQICYIGGVVSYITDYPLLSPKLSLVSNIGDFFLGATINTTVPNILVTAGSVVLVQAANAAAATRQGSSGGVYLSDKTAGVSFVVTTADGAAAAGTEHYYYSIFN